jgi:hypothetical protein
VSALSAGTEAEEVLGAARRITIKSPATKPPEMMSNLVAARLNDPKALQTFLYEGPPNQVLCLGAIGRLGKLCGAQACDCQVKAHKDKKGTLSPRTWYLREHSGEVVFASPSLPDSVAVKSGLFQGYKKDAHYPNNWNSIFQWVKSNAEASDPDQLMTTSASQQLLQEGTFPRNSVPKTPKLMKRKLGQLHDVAEDPLEFQEAVVSGLKTAELSLTELYSEVCKLSVRIGFPDDPTMSTGSVFSDIGTLVEFAADAESTFGSMHKTLTLYETLFKRCNENFLSYGTSIQQAVGNATLAFNAATAAQHTVHGINATGILGQLATQGDSIQQLATENKRLTQEVRELCSLIGNIVTGALPLPQSAANPSLPKEDLSLKKEIEAVRVYCIDQLKVIQQSAAGYGPVRIGNSTLDSAKSCAVQLCSWGITVSIFQHFQDPVHLLAAILHRSKTHEDVTQDAILSMKTSHDPTRLTAIASYETQVPELFGGARASKTDMSSQANFSAIKTFDLWDCGDGETGVKNFIELSLQDYLPQQATEADTLFGSSHPEFLAFIDLLRQKAATAVQEIINECSELYKNLLVKACGICTTYTSVQKADAWGQVLIFLQVYYHEMSKARAGARNLNSYSDPLIANSMAMWASVSALGVHEKFRACQYRDHPRIFPKLNSYFLQRSLRKADLLAVQEELTKLKSTVSRVDVGHAALRREYDVHKTDFGEMRKRFKTQVPVDAGGDGNKKKKGKTQLRGGPGANAGGSGDDAAPGLGAE